MLWLLTLASSLLSAVAGSPGYGPEPWLSGNPVASAASVVLSVHGTARFTVLSDALIRMECTSNGGGVWEDSRTLVVWNRALPTPVFSVDVTGNTTTITTSGFRLSHIDDGNELSAENLWVEMFTPAFSPNASRVWSPAQSVSTDPGQLFGTFHTLDDGFQPSAAGLNCSLLDPNNDSDGAADFFPCDFGLISTSGWSLVDDSRYVASMSTQRAPVLLLLWGIVHLHTARLFYASLDRSPVWDTTTGWLRTQDKALCPAEDGPSLPCFPGEWGGHCKRGLSYEHNGGPPTLWQSHFTL